MFKRKAEELDDDSPLLSSEDEEIVNTGATQLVNEDEGEGDAEGEGEAEAEAEGEAEAPEEEGEEVAAVEDKTDFMKLDQIWKQFTPPQCDRFENYRRSTLPRAQVKKLMQSIAGCTVSNPMSVAMAGITKILVGDVVETARLIMSERNETGPIRPTYIRQAYRRLRLEGKIPQKSALTGVDFGLPALTSTFRSSFTKCL